jgi:hypothetical protein
MSEVKNCRRWSTRLCIGLGPADKGGRTTGLPVLVAVGSEAAIDGGPAAVGALGVGGSGETFDLTEVEGPREVGMSAEKRRGVDDAGLWASI